MAKVDPEEILRQLEERARYHEKVTEKIADQFEKVGHLTEAELKQLEIYRNLLKGLRERIEVTKEMIKLEEDEKTKTKNLTDIINERIKALKEEAKAYNMSAEAAKRKADADEVARLKDAGASKTAIDNLKAAQKEAAAANAERRRGQGLREGLERGGGLMQMGFGAVSQMMSGHETGGQLVSQLGGTIGQFLTPIIGGFVTAFTGIIGHLVDVWSYHTEQMKKRTAETFASMIKGAQAFDTAVQSVRLRTLEEGFTNISNILASTTTAGGSIGGVPRNLVTAFQTGQEGLTQTEIRRTMERAQEQARVMQEFMNNPENRQLLVNVGMSRGGLRATDAALTARFAGEQADLTTTLANMGATAEQTADAMQRLAVAQGLVRDIGGDTNQAMLLLAGSLNMLARVQALTTAQGIIGQMAVQNREGRIGLAISNMQIENIRAQRGTLIPVVDQSRELVDLAIKRKVIEAAGLSTAQVDARITELRAERETRMEEDRARYGSETISRNRTSLEIFSEQMARLQDAQRPRGGRGPELSPEQAMREQGRLVSELIASAGPINRLPQLLEEGSAAAVTAAYKSQQEMQMADPLQALPAAMDALRAQQEAMLQQQRRAAEALERMAPPAMGAAAGAAAAAAALGG